uniref:Uncharacterized protein n=1 Tax=Salvator merianae TaxID=96440 RepID=A0A8D0CER0_SALMN
MVLLHLQDKFENKTDFLKHPNSHLVPSNHVNPPSEKPWQKDLKQTENRIPSGKLDGLSTTRDPYSCTLGNCSKAQEPEEQVKNDKPVTDTKNEDFKGKIHQVLIAPEKISDRNNQCAFDNVDVYFSSKESVYPAEEHECYPSRYSEAFTAQEWGKDSAVCSASRPVASKALLLELKQDHNEYMKSSISNEPENADVDSSLQNKVTADYASATGIPNILTGFEQPEHRICTAVGSRAKKIIPLSGETESSIIEATTTMHIRISGHEPSQIPQVSRHPFQIKNMPINLGHNFNIFANEESNRNKTNSKVTNCLKVKLCTRKSQDLVVCGKTSIQHQISKLKKTTSHMSGVPLREAGSPTKPQDKNQQQEKLLLSQNSQKSSKPTLLCISKSCPTCRDTETPFVVRQAQPSVDFRDIKYSDMFKEINSSDKGPGIYEMFGTPVYSREPDRHESRFCRNVHSAPVRRHNTKTHKPSHVSGKNINKIRKVHKKTSTKSYKNSFGTEQKQMDLVPKETPVLENSFLEQEENMLSGSYGETKSKKSTEGLNENDKQHLIISAEFIPPAQKNKVIPNSNLSTIEEISLELTSNASNTFIHRASVSNVKELLWPEVKVHVEYAPFLSCANDKNKHKNPEKSVLMQRKSEPNACLAEAEINQVLCQEKQKTPPARVDLPCPQNLQSGRTDLANLPNLSCHAGSSVSKGHTDIMCYNEKVIQDDLFCCSVDELLSLDSEHANCTGGISSNCSREIIENAHIEAQNRNSKGKDDDNEGNVFSKDLSLDFLESSSESRFLNVTTFSENSISNESPILWTKGEILGKGAYGTVSLIRSVYSCNLTLFS